MTKKDARKLAVAYQAFCEALATVNDNSIIVWGGMLAEIQTKVGVELQSFEVIGALICGARVRQDAAELAEANATLRAIA